MKMTNSCYFLHFWNTKQKSHFIMKIRTWMYGWWGLCFPNILLLLINQEPFLQQINWSCVRGNSFNEEHGNYPQGSDVANIYSTINKTKINYLVIITVICKSFITFPFDQKYFGVNRSCGK